MRYTRAEAEHDLEESFDLPVRELLTHVHAEERCGGAHAGRHASSTGCFLEETQRTAGVTR